MEASRSRSRSKSCWTSARRASRDSSVRSLAAASPVPVGLQSLLDVGKGCQLGIGPAAQGLLQLGLRRRRPWHRPPESGGGCPPSAPAGAAAPPPCAPGKRRRSSSAKAEITSTRLARRRRSSFSSVRRVRTSRQVHGGLEGPDCVYGDGDGQQERQRIHQEGRAAAAPDPPQAGAETAPAGWRRRPGQGAGEADIAVEVEGLLGVIPVTDFEEGLHGRHR